MQRNIIFPDFTYQCLSIQLLSTTMQYSDSPVEWSNGRMQNLQLLGPKYSLATLLTNYIWYPTDMIPTLTHHLFHGVTNMHSVP